MEEHHEQSKNDSNEKSVLEKMHTVKSDEKVVHEVKDNQSLAKEESKQDYAEIRGESEDKGEHQPKNSESEMKKLESKHPVTEEDNLILDRVVKEHGISHQKIESAEKPNHKSDESFHKHEHAKLVHEDKKILQEQEEEIAKEFHEDNDDTSRGNSVTHVRDRQKQAKVRDEEVNELDQINSMDLLDKQSMSLNQIKKAAARVQPPRKLSQGAHQRPQFSMNGLILARMHEYDGLRDCNLQPFFSNQVRRRVLVKNGLITDDGYIVRNPDEYLKKKDLYSKTNCYPEEASNARAHTLDKKKFNPYKENGLKKPKPLHNKSKANPKAKPTPLAKQEASKVSRK
jgi:hypothetical protein